MSKSEVYTIPGCYQEQSEAWLARGVLHSFSGKNNGTVADDRATRFLTLAQKHTATVLDMRDEKKRNAWYAGWKRGSPPIADGFIVPRRVDTGQQEFAIVTADCLPVFIATDSSIACVHAGWRGLAAGILLNALELLAVETTTSVAVLIGPAAGSGRYQVGAEVIEALGQYATCVPDDSGAYLLDLSATACKQVHSYVPQAECSLIPVCTISDERFYSYRRDPAGPGRNYACFKAV